MNIKINQKIISIPPYLSTTWAHISALHMQSNALAVTLIEGDTIPIPNLSPETIEQIFNLHAEFLENDVATGIISHWDPRPNEIKNLIEQMGQTDQDGTVRFAFGLGEDLSSTQHNPDQSDAPEIPAEILQKIVSITKVLGDTAQTLLSQPVPDCRCFHCQIARAVNEKIDDPLSEKQDDVSDEELQFQQWAIESIGDQLYSVTNRLDANETYHVFLGEPIGCTCGNERCEHILNVLKS